MSALHDTELSEEENCFYYVYCLTLYSDNTLPNDKILDVTKLKAFADDKLNVTKMMISLYDRVENTLGKGENAGDQHFLLFPQFFSKALVF